jgi:hypothetical protein
MRCYQRLSVTAVGHVVRSGGWFCCGGNSISLDRIYSTGVGPGRGDDIERWRSPCDLIVERTRLIRHHTETNHQRERAECKPAPNFLSRVIRWHSLNPY